MSDRYNFLFFEAEYRKYLAALNTKQVSIKNYASDLRYFFSWLQSSFQVDLVSLNELPFLLSKSVMSQYYTYLRAHSVSSLTFKRRVSTIRSFISFCVKQQWLTENTAKLSENDHESLEKYALVEEYCNYLKGVGSYYDIARQKSLIINFIES